MDARETCMKRASALNKYCSVKDSEMFFVPGKVLPQAAPITTLPPLEEIEEITETTTRVPVRAAYLAATTSSTTTPEPIQHIMSHIEDRGDMSDFIQQVDKEAEAEFNEQKRAAEEAEAVKASERERRNTIRKSAEKAQGVADAKKDTMEKARKMLEDQAVQVRKAAKDVEAANKTAKAAQKASADAAADVESAGHVIQESRRALVGTEEQMDAQEADGRDPGEALRQKVRDEREAVTKATADAEEKKSRQQQAFQRELDAKAALQDAETKLSMEKAEQKPLDERFRLAVAEYEAARDYASIRNSLASSTRDLESAEAKEEADRKAAAEKQLRDEHEAKQAEKAKSQEQEAAERAREDVWANFKAAERAAEKAAQETAQKAKEEAERRAREDTEERAREEAERRAKAKEDAARQVKAKEEAEKQANAKAKVEAEAARQAKANEEVEKQANAKAKLEAEKQAKAAQEAQEVLPEKSAEHSAESPSSAGAPARSSAGPARASGQASAGDEGRLPADPGCYMRMPTGCQSHSSGSTKWRRDRWAEDRGLGAPGCARRKEIWDHYCQRKDVEIGYVAAQASQGASGGSPEAGGGSGSKPVSALQLGESPASPWPWSKKPATDAARAGARGEAEAVDAYPAEPGCYMRMASGCPKNPMKTDLWRHDSWAERHGLDRAGCESRKKVWDTHCATEDAQVVFVSSKTSSEAVSALQLGEAPAWPWPWFKQQAKGKAKATAQLKAEANDAYPSEPGCYMRMASGCPKNPMKTDLWRHDSWAERKGLDEAGCKLRKPVWDKFCAAEDAEFFFVSSTASSQ